MKKCKNCKYRTNFSGGNVYGCQYILITGHMRGCPVEDCTKYEYSKNPAKDPLASNERLFDVRK